ncbi:MAG: AraC family transcriptional regulator [Verrucomicrobia bacterium]|nr:AraC family transcriptional regulator [Verrucomicrobiota bacterium]
MPPENNCLERTIKVLIFIEENIDEELSLEHLAKLANYSSSHFHRIFQGIVGETVHSYIKRLRLEKAAGKLKNTEQPVTHIALDASYETPSSFTKAFKQTTGMTPQKYRSAYSAIKRLADKIKEMPMIRPECIEKKFKDLELLFVRRQGNYALSAAKAWVAMIHFIEDNKIDPSQLRYFGISHDDPQVTNEEKLRYDAAITVPHGIKEKGEVGKQRIKAGNYAVFIHHGSYNGLESTFEQIFLKWLPLSREQLDETRPVFCEYFNMEHVLTEPEKLITKIHIPLI